MEVNRLHEEVQEVGEMGLMDFIPFVSPTFRAPHHLAPIVRELERVPHESLFLGIEVPPQHHKTETLLHSVARWLKYHPDLTVGYVSYAQKYSESKALKGQRYAERAGVVPDKKMRNRSEWRTREGGGLLATGIGGPLTGQALNIAVVDDPIKNPAEANSRVMRNKHWEWFSDVLETRFTQGTSCIVLMTRWHEDDLLGRIMKQRPEYRIIRLPALADGLDAVGKNPAPDPLGREIGEPLLPSHRSKDDLETIRRRNPYTFASLYQGLPRPREAKLFGDATFYHTLPNDVSYSIGVDLAYTASTRADWSVAVVFAVVEDAYYLVHVERWQAEINESIERLQRIQARYPARMHVEANGPQKAVCDMLESRKIRVNRLQPTADKYVRAQPFAEAWNAGRVLLPENAPWLNSYLEELNDFTGINDAVDDQVDASANGFQRIKRPRILV
jgi:predicted phage terminase large subunit-like protein